MGTETSPWGEPGIVSGDTEQHSRRVKKETDRDIGESTDKAKGNSRGLTDEQYNTDPTKLNKWQNVNHAKNSEQFGRLNNRDYSTTLRLAREADRYNNKPQEKALFFHAGAPGSTGTLSEVDKYNRPNIETMETRAMDQSWQLDTNQKMLAQALQDAVNHKDLEAFKDLYKQLFGIELDEMQAELAFTQLARTLQVQNIFSKDSQRWMSHFSRAFGADTALTLYNMVQDGKPMAANMLAGQLLNGTMPPEQFELFMQDYEQELIKEYKAQGMEPQDAKKAANLKAENDRIKYQRELNIQNKVNTNSWAQGMDSTRALLWQAAGLYR